MKQFIKKALKRLFGSETEYSKKWMARVTIAVMTVFLFVIPFALILIFCNLKWGLSWRICRYMFNSYTTLLKVTVSGYFVAFIGYMGKAFLSKKEEEKNKLKSNDKGEDWELKSKISSNHNKERRI